jgi:hypothetical protein
MSSATIIFQGDNQLHVDYDTSKIFVFDNKYISDTLINSSGGPLTYLPGTLVGRVTANNKLQPVASGAVDGSQFPVGILKTQVTALADAGEAKVNVCIFGEVVRAKVILAGADTLDTMIDGRSIKDRIAGNTMGIKLVDGFELTRADNA